MSHENVEIVRSGVGGSMRGRAAALAATLVAVACLLCVGLPVRAAAATAFRQVTAFSDPPILGSDGMRFVTLKGDVPDIWPAVRVFDTLARRSFRATGPSPDCRFVDVGGGVVLWQCADSSRYMLTDLATGEAREPVGWAAVEATKPPLLPGYPAIPCYAYRIGRYWLQGGCGYGSGSESLFYLNHRTGRLLEASSLLTRYPELLSGPYAYQRINLDYRGLVTPPQCAPFRQGWAHISLPPFTLSWRFDEYEGIQYGNILLRRCGERRAQILSRCPSNNCAAAQLGSRYVTWAEGNRVFAYLPRGRRRVLVAPAPTGARIFERPVDVVHTCDRVFAQWPDGALYVARFKPREGAPRCQTAK